MEERDKVNVCGRKEREKKERVVTEQNEREKEKEERVGGE